MPNKPPATQIALPSPPEGEDFDDEETTATYVASDGETSEGGIAVV